MVTYYIIPNYIINYFIWRRERTEYSSRSMRCLELSFYPQLCLHKGMGPQALPGSPEQLD